MAGTSIGLFVGRLLEKCSGFRRANWTSGYSPDVPLFMTVARGLTARVLTHLKSAHVQKYAHMHAMASRLECT